MPATLADVLKPLHDTLAEIEAIKPADDLYVIYCADVAIEVKRGAARAVSLPKATQYRNREQAQFTASLIRNGNQTAGRVRTLAEARADAIRGMRETIAFAEQFRNEQSTARTCEHCGKSARGQAGNSELCEHCGAIL